MKRSTSHIVTGIALLVVGYVLDAMGATQDGWAALLAVGIPITFAGGCLVFAGIVSAGVRWALEDVQDQRMIERLAKYEDEDAHAE